MIKAKSDRHVFSCYGCRNGEVVPSEAWNNTILFSSASAGQGDEIRVPPGLYSKRECFLAFRSSLSRFALLDW